MSAKTALPPTDEQQAILDHAARCPGEGRKVSAAAGSGKTSTLEMMAERRRDPGLYVAFNRSIKQEAARRFPRHIKVTTAHGAAYAALRMHEQQARLDRRLYGDAVGQLVRLPRCRMPEDALGQVVIDTVDRFCNSAELKLGIEHVALDPREPEDIRLSALSGAQALWARMADPRDDCPLTHDAYLKQWHIGGARLRAEWALFDEAQDASPVMIEVMRAQDFPITWVGDSHQCHPPGTMVTMSGPSVRPIEDIKVGDHVVAYSTRAGAFRGLYGQGRTVEHIHRAHFKGEMIRFVLGDKTMSATPNHRCLVRFNGAKKYALYLMCRGDQFRIGMADMHYQRGNGVSLRTRHERADAAWILDVFDSRKTVRVAEEKYSALYGIPQLIFRAPDDDPDMQGLLDAAWAEIGTNRRNAERLLTKFKRLPEFPFWSRDTMHAHMGNAGKYSFVTQACNVLPDVMSMAVMPVDPSTPYADTTVEWRPVQVSRFPYDGEVIGIQVEPTEGGRRVYLANGVVTHNSIYQFRGAVNAMRQMPGKEFPLSQSFRFGQAVADYANAVLGCKPEGQRPSFTIRGNPGRASQVGRVPQEERHAFLARTNAEWFAEALRFEGRVHVLGGIEETERLLIGAWGLWRHGQRPTRCPAVARFATWAQLCEHAERFDDRELTFARRIVEQYQQRLPDAVADLRDRHVTCEDDAQLVLATAHKAKGREFSLVRLGQGFPGPFDEEWARMTPEAREAELNLLYVALTRAVDGLEPNRAVLDCLAAARGGVAGQPMAPPRLVPIRIVRPQPAVPDASLLEAALASTGAKPKRRARARPAAGTPRPWTTEDDAEATELASQGIAPEEASTKLGRPAAAVVVRYAVLRLPGADPALAAEMAMALAPPMPPPMAMPVMPDTPPVPSLPAPSGPPPRNDSGYDAMELSDHDPSDDIRDLAETPPPFVPPRAPRPLFPR